MGNKRKQGKVGFPCFKEKNDKATATELMRLTFLRNGFHVLFCFVLSRIDKHGGRSYPG